MDKFNKMKYISLESKTQKNTKENPVSLKVEGVGFVSP
jgi:hypothetical protein